MEWTKVDVGSPCNDYRCRGHVLHIRVPYLGGGGGWRCASPPLSAPPATAQHPLASSAALLGIPLSCSSLPFLASPDTQQQPGRSSDVPSMFICVDTQSLYQGKDETDCRDRSWEGDYSNSNLVIGKFDHIQLYNETPTL